MSDNSTPFDLSAFEATDTAIFDLADARDEPLMYNGQPVRVELYGPGSEQAAAAQAKVDRAMQSLAMSAAIAANKGKQQIADNSAEIRKLHVEKLTACTKALVNFPIPGGARTVYENPRMGYITKQVERLLGDWSRFLPPAAKISSSTPDSLAG